VILFVLCQNLNISKSILLPLMSSYYAHFIRNSIFYFKAFCVKHCKCILSKLIVKIYVELTNTCKLIKEINKVVSAPG
jgi:hypothetical protein